MIAFRATQADLYHVMCGRVGSWDSVERARYEQFYFSLHNIAIGTSLFFKTPFRTQ